MPNRPAHPTPPGPEGQRAPPAKQITTGRRDTLDPLTIPNRLYGRDRDMVTLLASFERISRGQGEVLLLPGSSGVGKTALVQELQGPVRDRNGYFVRGKFDQNQQNIPYFAFRQALAELGRELQSGDAPRRARLKADILQAVGHLGQVLVDLVPEFEAFLGPQPPLERISPQEARHRFADVCRHFLQVIGRPEHPLVLFLDDWQWADAASCELLKQMQVGSTLRYLLVIASYRDNEVDSSHPLMSAVDDLRSQRVPVQMFRIESITAQDVQEMVADAFKPAIEDGVGLAAIIHRQTLGNPFFVRSLLTFLQEDHLLWLDQVRNCWRWRPDLGRGADLPVDVVALFVLKLRRLDQASRELLSLAACLGNRFDLATLSTISGRPLEECLALLSSDQASSFFQPRGDDGGDILAEAVAAPEVWHFLHDRVQQAAYSLIEPEELPRLRLTIGRQLLAHLEPEQLAVRLFEVVSDLNAGCHLMPDAAEQVKVVELNLTAARRAYAATAYRSALEFYRSANRCLDLFGLAEPLWRDRHALMLPLFQERAQCEFLEGHHAEAERCIQQAVAHAATALEKAAILRHLIVQKTLLACYPEAVAVGRQALNALGLSLPEEGYQEARDQEIAQVRQTLGNRPVASLLELPVMSDPEMLMASEILIALGPPCYRSDQRLWSVIVPRVVNLILRYGNIPQIGYSHPALGGLLGWVDDDYATAQEFAEVATRLMTSTFRSPSDQSVFYLMIGSSIRHWFRHLRHGTQDYREAYDIGLRSGNLQYAAYAFGHDMYCRFYQGVPLATLIQETQRSLVFSRTRHNQWAIDLLEGGLSIFGALAGESPASSNNEPWSETDYLRRVADRHNIQVTCIYRVLKAFSLLVSGDHEGALAWSDEAEPLIYTVGTQGLLPWPEHVSARFLILTALYAKAEGKRQTQWRAELERMLPRLRLWADNGPDNFEHKYLLAAAEWARMDGRPGEAMELYDRAADGARIGSFLQWEGLAHERAYHFWQERGEERLARGYWQQAYHCFHRWGAAPKVHAMEAAFRIYLGPGLPAGDGSVPPAEKLEQEPRNARVERQITQLRHDALQRNQDAMRVEATTEAGELAEAMQRVRVEIAERKRTEIALRESEERLAAAQAMAKTGSWETDLSTMQVIWSDELYRVFGVDPDRFASSHSAFLELVHPQDRAMVNAAFAESLDKLSLHAIEHRIVTPTGLVKSVEERWRILRDDQGRPARAAGTCQDITERKRSEAELAEVQSALVHASRRAGMAEIAANVLHEIGNALNSVNISAGLIVESVKRSRAPSLAQVVALLREHAPELGPFMTEDARGQHVLAHLAQLSEHLLADQAAIVGELDSLRRHVEHIKSTVAMQQDYAAFGAVRLTIDVPIRPEGN